MLPYLDNALRAYVIYKRDKDYIVKDGEVIIVDQFTGRLMYGRRFSEGLHQAIEAKERVAVRRESMTYATVTFQNYFRMYEKLAGMTGTAKTEEEEFRSIYNLDVMVLPTNVEYRATYGDLEAHDRPADEIEEVDFSGLLNGHTDNLGLPQQTVTVTTYEPTNGTGDERRYFKRLDMPDVIYGTERAKFQALADDIETLHKIGQPILVGTIAIETSERLSQVLERRGVPHQVLNGKLHEQEAMIIAQAGSPGTVTIATNMAGRGVDIVLGGNPEGLTAKLLEQRFRKTAEKFAQAIVDGQEQQAHEIIKGASGFSPDSLERAKRLSAEYEAYAETASSPQRRARLIADQLLEEGVIGRHYHGPIVGLAVLTMREDWVAAMDGARLPEGLSQRIISEIQRVRAQYETPDNKTAYIADGLFNYYYTAMSALIRTALQNKPDSKQQARMLVEQYPELTDSLITEIENIKNKHEQDRQHVCAMGGLHVIGTERHESRRIDNQLRGRAGRQGDPGSSRFYISLEDELMRRFGGERVQGLMGRFGVEEDMPLQHSWLDKTIESAQARVEGYNFDIRKHVLEYDDVVNKQREFFYAQRRQALDATDLRDQVLRMVQEEISQLVVTHMPGPDPDDWDLSGLYHELRVFLPLAPDVRPTKWVRMTQDEVESELHRRAELAYDELTQKLAEPLFEQAQQENLTLVDLSNSSDTLQRLVYKRILDRLDADPEPDLLDTPIRKLSAQTNEQVQAGFVDGARLHRDRHLILGAVDSLWVRHLTNLEALREGIGLRAYGQQNPLVAYRKEAHAMYDTLLADVQRIVARSAYLVSRPAPPRPQRQQRQTRTPHSRPQSGESRGAPEQLPGRNDPCWCGSGLKYKNCHMRLDSRKRQEAATAARPRRTSSGGKKGRRKRRR
jgi:preprotein translocase subunit SecA